MDRSPTHLFETLGSYLLIRLSNENSLKICKRLRPQPNVNFLLFHRDIDIGPGVQQSLNRKNGATLHGLNPKPISMSLNIPMPPFIQNSAQQARNQNASFRAPLAELEAFGASSTPSLTSRNSVFRASNKKCT